MATYMLEEFYNLTFQASSNNHPCIRIAEDKDDGGTQVKNCPPVLNFLSFFRWNMKEPWTMTFRFQYLRVTICSLWSLGVVPDQHNAEIECLQWFWITFFPPQVTKRVTRWSQVSCRSTSIKWLCSDEKSYKCCWLVSYDMAIVAKKLDL